MYLGGPWETGPITPRQDFSNNAPKWVAATHREIITSGVSEVAQVDWSADLEALKFGGHTLTVVSGFIEINEENAGSSYDVGHEGTSRSWECKCDSKSSR